MRLSDRSFIFFLHVAYYIILSIFLFKICTIVIVLFLFCLISLFARSLKKAATLRVDAI